MCVSILKPVYSSESTSMCLHSESCNLGNKDNFFKEVTFKSIKGHTSNSGPQCENTRQ